MRNASRLRRHFCTNGSTGIPWRTTTITVVKQNTQHTGFDCGVWTLYVMYWRMIKRSTLQDPHTLFADMDLKDQIGDTQFRYLIGACVILVCLYSCWSSVHTYFLLYDPCLVFLSPVFTQSVRCIASFPLPQSSHPVPCSCSIRSCTTSAVFLSPPPTQVVSYNPVLFLLCSSTLDSHNVFVTDFFFVHPTALVSCFLFHVVPHCFLTPPTTTLLSSGGFG